MNIDKIIKNVVDKNIKKENENTFKVLEEAYLAQQKAFNVMTDYLSSENLNNHIELYKGYLSNFNEISAKLDAADRSSVNSNHHPYRSLKLDETYNMNAVYLHELFFANIGDNNSQISMDTLSYMRLSRDFGTFDDWQKDFIATAQSARCGWAITYLNTFTQSYMNCFIDLHSQNVPTGMYPVIVMDMWQHSYYKDYLKDSKKYLSAMMKQFNWRVIEKRFQKADKIINVLKEV
jgi:Fe-Mn family superoxide dismutase